MRPAPEHSGSGIEIRMGIQKPRENVPPAGVLKSDQLQPSGRPANSANQFPPVARVGKSGSHSPAAELHVSRSGSVENPAGSPPG
jgi:hypothetical protein